MENYSMPSQSNIKLEVTVEHLGLENGSTVTPVWFGFHDGSFNTFDLNSPASSGLEYLAEDGVTGLEGTVPGGLQSIIDQGVNPDLIPPQEETISGIFAAQTEGSTQGVIVGERLLLFNPGETVSTTVELEGNIEQNRFFNFASMLIPSNDAFIGNDDPIEIFDEEGNFVADDEILVLGNQVLDAGTEVNTESPLDVPLTPETVGLGGPDENGVVTRHQGLRPLGSGGLLDFGDGILAEADFTTPGFQVARITVNPVIDGTAEGDRLSGSIHNEHINGLEGNDLIFGENGDDTLEGGDGDDRLYGKNDNDKLLGGNGRDFLVGGNGDDLLDGGAYQDSLFGNEGADQFVLRLGDGRDTIFDYQNRIDSLSLADGLQFEDLTITQGLGGTVVINTETHEELAVLIDINANQIGMDDFNNLM
jgi:hypothetical protein